MVRDGGAGWISFWYCALLICMFLFDPLFALGLEMIFIFPLLWLPSLKCLLVTVCALSSMRESYWISMRLCISQDQHPSLSCSLSCSSCILLPHAYSQSRRVSSVVVKEMHCWRPAMAVLLLARFIPYGFGDSWTPDCGQH